MPQLEVSGKNKLDSVVYFLISGADVAYSHSGRIAKEVWRKKNGIKY